MGDMGRNTIFFCEKGEERRNHKFKVVREYQRLYYEIQYI